MTKPSAQQQPSDKPATTSKKARTDVELYVRPLIRLEAVVASLHTLLVPFLQPEEVGSLLACCSHTLPSDTCERLATDALKAFYIRDEVHWGLGCITDWHQLVPLQPVGARSPRCYCCRDTLSWESYPAPEDLALPRLDNARVHLLEAMRLVSEGIMPHCFKVLQMLYDRDFKRFGTLQPVVFSLAVALEYQQQQQQQKRTPAKIDTNNIMQLTRLLNSVEPNFGSRFFRKVTRKPSGSVEAHWQGISVDLDADTTTCQYCKNADKMLGRFGELVPKEAASYARSKRPHCEAVYQPLKKFMARHLKHIHYLRPPRGWNRGSSEFHDDKSLDLIAGFTSSGVLCGVYLTDPRISSKKMRARLAPGWIDKHLPPEQEQDLSFLLG